jgi:tRNA-splicing ligase RtcB
MNKRQLAKLGFPPHALQEASAAVGQAAVAGYFANEKAEHVMRQVLSTPAAYQGHPVFGALADRLIEEPIEGEYASIEPVEFREWGSMIDDDSRRQMRDACALPVSVAGALMPDAHIGYGLPIGGVLATDNAVIPYAVGVDIACRMKLSITDLHPDLLEAQPELFDKSLERGTCFGVGKAFDRRQKHDVLDADWSATPWLQNLKDLAAKQLGTSGSGNHFVEWGVLELREPDLGLEPGSYLALLSHSGSRGPGARTCEHYSKIAADRLPRRYERFQRLAWLDLDSQEGQDYWTAMNLMGEFASANHAVLHRNVLKLAGAESIAGVENHHNFAWREELDGKTVYVHRKGATPAGEGVLGVIPGNMADTCFVVRGKGSTEAINSSAHGAGRVMSRTAAKKEFRWKPWREHLKQKGVRLLAAGLDEVPGVYKNIHEVMAAQSDLVDIVARFQPKVVMMCGDGSRAED